MAANKSDIKNRILNDPDYVRCPKTSNSLTKFLTKNPDGAEDSTIARLLMVDEDDIPELYDEAVEMLRESMKSENDE
jgi:hypothetical protein